MKGEVIMKDLIIALVLIITMLFGHKIIRKMDIFLDKQDH